MEFTEASPWADLGNTTWAGLQARDSLFSSFWKSWKDATTRTLEGKVDVTLDDLLNELQKRSWQMTTAMTDFRHFIEEIPLVVAIGFWIRGETTELSHGAARIHAMNKLIEKNLIPLKTSDGTLSTLRDLRWLGHKHIIDSIRCVKEWGIVEKENLVSTYLQFSHSLGRTTLGFIPPGMDPDRQTVLKKAVRYEIFMDLIQHLSLRDALLVKLIYFGAPTIADVLSLCKRQIDLAGHQVKYPHATITYPKHLMLDLQEYTQNKNEEDLVFVNTNGERIERSHLNHSFRRILSKNGKKQQFSPGDLLEVRQEDAEIKE